MSPQLKAQIAARLAKVANNPANNANNSATLTEPKRARRPAKTDEPLQTGPTLAGDVKPARRPKTEAPAPSEPPGTAERRRGRPAVKTDPRSLAARERMRAKRAAAKDKP